MRAIHVALSLLLPVACSYAIGRPKYVGSSLASGDLLIVLAKSAAAIYVASSERVDVKVAAFNPREVSRKSLQGFVESNGTWTRSFLRP
jgi:hypothetical protein